MKYFFIFSIILCFFARLAVQYINMRILIYATLLLLSTSHIGTVKFSKPNQCLYVKMYTSLSLSATVVTHADSVGQRG